MNAQPALPLPMQRMLELLNIDIALGFETMPEEMESAIVRCLMCSGSSFCDDDTESRYFLCANRDFLDRLERQQDLV